MAPQVLRIRQAAARLGISVPTLYRRFASPGFPQPISLGGKAVGLLIQHDLTEHR
jgi:predicted DNA-binding transcriptional regulator AlpA